MPRDLQHERTASPTQITESPKSDATEKSDSPDSTRWSEEEASNDRQKNFVIVPEDQQNKATGRLHPYTRPLTVSDVDSCLALENSAFKNPEERATREKVRTSLCFETDT